MFVTPFEGSLLNRFLYPIYLVYLGMALSLSWSCDGEDTPQPNDAGIEAGTLGGTRTSLGFDDHMVSKIISTEHFDALSTEDGDHGSIVKFYLTGFQNDAVETVHFLDGSFYQLHDELYWMRLLNGLRVWGIEHIEPIRGLSLSTVEEAYQWAHQQQALGYDLPLDLIFANDERLYSPYFYQVALGRPRQIALGTVLHIPARQERVKPEEIWAYELEFSDQPTADEIVTMSRRLRAALPPEASELMWLTRSPAQEALAEQMREEQLPEWDQIISYYDLTTPGEVKVYSEGLSAGRLYVIRAGEDRPLLPNQSILLFDHVPDELPATQGLITTVPQTPLAHINLLAQNRGIPNLYVSGLSMSPLINQFEMFHPGVILWAREPDQWRLELMSQEELNTYRSLLRPPMRTLSEVNLSSQPLIYDLEALNLAQSLSLRSVMGGKAAGLVACLETQAATPYRPLVITGRAYEEHIRPFKPYLEGLFEHPAFRNEQVRAISLEGLLGFMQRYPGTEREELDQVISTLRMEHGDDDPVVWWSDRGGVQNVLRTKPISMDHFGEILSTLRTHFEALSPQQGLRFRSSSNVEDLEGFNGAGLYSSKTGYLYPQAQMGTARSKTVDWALREVWASYWGVEAFRERETEGIPHLSGHMSALVHPNFQDELELANGVVVLTLTPPPTTQLPEQSQDELPSMIAKVVINAQAGALSVTNPDRLGALPEVIQAQVWIRNEAWSRLTWPYENLAQHDQEWSSGVEINLERLQPSSEQEQVLNDEQIQHIVLRSLEASARWLTEERRRTPSAQATRFLTLDLEFRLMGSTWPLARRTPEEVGGGSERIILKQARPLVSSSRGLSEGLYELDIPRDLLWRARRIERITCDIELPMELGGGTAFLSVHQIYTDPLAQPDLGYDSRPFSADLSLEGWPLQEEATPWYSNHENLTFLSGNEGSGNEGQPWSLQITPHYDFIRPAPIAYLSMHAQDDSLDNVSIDWINHHADEVNHQTAHCIREPLFAEPSEYLRILLESRPSRE